MLFFRLSYNWNLKENLGTHLRDNQAYKLSGDFELFRTLGKLGETKSWNVLFVSNFSKPFSPPLSQNLAKSNDRVSLLTKFLELKFDYRFGCRFHIFVHANFCNGPSYLDPFKPNPSKNAWRSFTSDQFLRIEIWS